MCNIAGYIGNKQAAPILIEMMSKQHGFGGGYYTGIATLHEGKMYYAKVAGDLDKLLSDTNAADLPGTIGFIHSRSYGNQNMEWSHPFISDDDKMAYIANGFGGVLLDKAQNEISANALLDKGYKFRTAMPIKSEYIYLKDGTTIHTSELVAHMIADNYRSGMPFGEGMMKVMLDRPSEVVGLAIHQDIPDTIFVARYNFPMMTARAEGETFLATTAMVFPKDRKYHTMEALPCMAMSEVKVDGYKVTGFKNPPMDVKVIDAKMWHDAYDIVCDCLQNSDPNDPVDIGAPLKACKHLWPEGLLNQDAMLVYEILRMIDEQGKLHIVKKECEGPAEGIKRTHFHMYMDK